MKIAIFPNVKINNIAELRDKLADVIATSGPVIRKVIFPENQEIMPAVSTVKNSDGGMTTSKSIEDMYSFLEREEFLNEMTIKPV